MQVYKTKSNNKFFCVFLSSTNIGVQVGYLLCLYYDAVESLCKNTPEMIEDTSP